MEIKMVKSFSRNELIRDRIHELESNKADVFNNNQIFWTSWFGLISIQLVLLLRLLDEFIKTQTIVLGKHVLLFLAVFFITSLFFYILILINNKNGDYLNKKLKKNYNVLLNRRNNKNLK
jgi:hypothetical protein